MYMSNAAQLAMARTKHPPIDTDQCMGSLHPQTNTLHIVVEYFACMAILAHPKHHPTYVYPKPNIFNISICVCIYIYMQSQHPMHRLLFHVCPKWNQTSEMVIPQPLTCCHMAFATQTQNSTWAGRGLWHTCIHTSSGFSTQLLAYNYLKLYVHFKCTCRGTSSLK